MTGRIKSYSSKKGYGFIQNKNGDVFFDHKTLPNRNCVKAGMRVRYDLEKQFVARKVVLL